MIAGRQDASPALKGLNQVPVHVAAGGLARKESRGAHYREDYPQRDDKNWLKRTLAYWKAGASEPSLEYETVDCPLLPPGDRGYGEQSKPAAQTPAKA